MPNKSDFDTTFSRLKAILKPYEPKLVLTTDTDKEYLLDVNYVMKNKRRMFFAGVRKGKAYVSFHFMPVYAFAPLAEKMSPELKRRMQGKSCFNFSSPDEKLFKELAQLTKQGYAKFTDQKFYSQF
jgi:hypothetical protein